MHTKQLITWLSQCSDPTWFIKKLRYPSSCLPTRLRFSQSKQTANWRVFCCCRSLQHCWTYCQALLVYRSSISKLFRQLHGFQKPQIAVFCLSRWPTAEVKKAKAKAQCGVLAAMYYGNGLTWAVSYLSRVINLWANFSLRFFRGGWKRSCDM